MVLLVRVNVGGSVGGEEGENCEEEEDDGKPEYEDAIEASTFGIASEVTEQVEDGKEDDEVDTHALMIAEVGRSAMVLWS